MSELTSEQRESLLRDLVTLSEALASALTGSRESTRPVDLDQPIGRLSRIDALAQQQMAQASRAGIGLRAKQVAAAMARFEAGDYGQCLACGEPVGYARLAARPESAFCITCQARSEKR
jgi:DnaK suppressor protein